MKEAYLVMVNANNNNNKYYHMVQMNDGMFEVTYGRVGKAGQTREYPIWDWDKKYYEKIDKGYRDVTELQSAPVKEEYATSSGTEAVNELLETLHYYSSNYIKENYRVGADKVTPKMVDEAQGIIARMQKAANKSDIMQFNWLCEELFMVIPRIIPNVKEAVAKELSDMTTILEREQAKLNVMNSSVEIKKVNGKSLADSMGIEIREVTEEEKQNILNHLDNSTKSRFVRAFRVVNAKTEKKFNDFVKKNGYADEDIKFLYHGSRNQNWEGILSQGLKLNNKAPKTGHMLGRGHYFSRPGNTTKSVNYTSLQSAYWNHENEKKGFIAVYKVAMKNPKHMYDYENGMNRFTQKEMDAQGFDGVYAHKNSGFLRNDELVVYEDCRCTVRYFIEVA